MKCPKCNVDVAADATVCGACGTPLTPAGSSNPFSDQQPYAAPQQQPVQGSNMADDLALRMLIPIGRSVHSIIAGYLGLLSLGCCPLGPFAILFGVLAVLDIRKNPKKGGIVRAIVGIVLGSIGTLGLVAVIISMMAGGLSQN
jgi:hypothetical protein